MDIAQLFSNIVVKVAAAVLLVVGLIFPALAPHTIVSAPEPAPATVEAPATATTSQAAKPVAVSKSPGGGAPSGVKPDGKEIKKQDFSSSPTPALSDTDLNNQTRSALVNIACTVAGNQFKPITASGVLIDSRGVILTNAHMGQFLLLRNYGGADNIDCVVRTGSPAQPRYSAKLLYLPERWVNDNAAQLKSQQATGTGENDYAFLLITGTTNPSAALPSEFPYLAMKTSTPDVGQRMLLAAYPAGFLSGELIATSLYASSAFAYVTQLFSFDGGPQVDLFSIGGTVESQAGSSGGAVVRGDGTLAGIIVTATLDSSTTGARDLRALTLAHIDRSLGQFGQGGVSVLLSGDINAKAADFNKNLAPTETKKLEDVLNNVKQ